MKPLRQLCAITVLTFVLAASSFAGEMATGAVPPPPPDPPAPMMSEMGGAAYTNGSSSDETGSIDPLAEFTFSILQSVLSLF